VRVVEVVAFVVFLGGFVVLARTAMRAASAAGRRQLAAAEGWEPFHRLEGDRRRVYVRRGEELEPVGEVAPDAGDYDAAFLRLMDRARERAAVLNSER
jgi:hypothetical protein